MRTAHLISFWAFSSAVMGTALPSFATGAAAPHHPPLTALEPAAPTVPLHHEALPVSSTIVEQAGDWKAANAAVGAFPRGHADVVRWEKEQGKQVHNSPRTKPLPAMPATEQASHHLHGGQP